MPELPEVERVRRRLEPAIAGARFTRVRLNRADLRKPFPRQFVQRLRGATVVSLTRRGKYLLASLSTGETLVMHLGMSGSFRVEPTPQVRRRRSPDAALDARHDHVVFEMSSGQTITFNDPRRFGVMDLVRDARRTRRGSAHVVDRLGPEPLSDAFNGPSLARRVAGRRTSLKVTLLDQRSVAGLGNIYASEALHLARLSPLRHAATITTRTGEPRPAAQRLAAAIKTVLRRAIRLKATDDYSSSGRFRVYDREGEPCSTPGCKGIIRRIWQAGRSTFYCPVCQR